MKPSILIKKIEHVIDLLAHIRQDSEELNIDKKFKDFIDEIEIFENRSKKLMSNVQGHIESVINKPDEKYRYLKILSNDQNEVTALKEQISQSYMFSIYSKFVAERHLAIALNDPSKQYINRQTLVKELEERQSILFSMMEESKQNEINKYKKELEEQKEAFINQTKTGTDNPKLECEANKQNLNHGINGQDSGCPHILVFILLLVIIILSGSICQNQ